MVRLLLSIDSKVGQALACRKSPIRENACRRQRENGRRKPALKANRSRCVRAVSNNRRMCLEELRRVLEFCRPERTDGAHFRGPKNKPVSRIARAYPENRSGLFAAEFLFDSLCELRTERAAHLRAGVMIAGNPRGVSVHRSSIDGGPCRGGSIRIAPRRDVRRRPALPIRSSAPPSSSDRRSTDRRGRAPGSYHHGPLPWRHARRRRPMRPARQ